MRPRRGSRGRWSGALGAALAGALILGGCTSQPPDDPDITRVSVFGPFRDEAADLFRASLEPFEAASGIDVVYTGSGDFEGEIVDRVEGGDPPDIAIFPQPGLLNLLADEAYVLPLPDDLAATARESYRAGIDELVGSLTEVNGVVYRVNVKSLVWYDPATFAEQGYEVPASWPELRALAQLMVLDGFTPWCLGVDSFGASGWPATDWIEEIVLRSSGPDLYDAWVAGDIPFTDDRIAAAFLEFEEMLLGVDETLGGRRGVLNTSVQRAGDPLLEDPAGCLMYRQASFQVDNWPDDVAIGPQGDVDVFVLPPMPDSLVDDDPGDGAPPSESPEEASTGDGTAPLVVGGTLAAALVDRPEVWQTVEFLATAASGLAWAEAGGFISPHDSVGPEDYPNAFDAAVSALLDEADVVRFDGSDLMDPRVGTGTFFDGVLHFIGTARLQEALVISESGYRSSAEEAAVDAAPDGD